MPQSSDPTPGTPPKAEWKSGLLLEQLLFSTFILCFIASSFLSVSVSIQTVFTVLELKYSEPLSLHGKSPTPILN